MANLAKVAKAHWLYCKYVVRHKYWVFRKGRITGVPLWRLIIHDWSKFLPSEWFPYVNYFYGGGNGVQQHRENGGHYDPTQGPLAFNVAWLRHQHRQPHHWQHWVLREDSGVLKPLPMPKHFVAEMVADWAGAGRAQGHGDDVLPWYLKNRDKMVLHDKTERLVMHYLMLLARESGQDVCQCGARGSLPVQCLFNGYCAAHMIPLPAAGFSEVDLLFRREKVRAEIWSPSAAEAEKWGLHPAFRKLNSSIVYDSRRYPNLVGKEPMLAEMIGSASEQVLRRFMASEPVDLT